MPTKKVYTNTLAQIWWKVVTALISIGLIKILTNYLDVAGYGMYSKIYNYLSIFAVIADLGLYTITVREISEHKEKPEMVRKIVWNVLTLRTGLWGIIIFLSLAIALFLPGYNSPTALLAILITSIFTCFWLINSSIMSLLQAYLKTEFSFFSITLGKITTFLCVVAIVYLGYPHTTMMQDETSRLIGFNLIMLAWLIGNMVMTGLTYMYARNIEQIRFRFDWSYVKHILVLSLPYGIALFLNVIFFKVDVILLSLLESGAMADISIALYALPMKIVEVGMMYGTLFLNSMLPLLTMAITKNDTKEKKRLTEKALFILSFFGIGMAFFLYTYASEVIHILASKAYFENAFSSYTSEDAMQIVTWIFLFYFLSSLFTYILIAANEQRKMMYINAWIALFNIIGNILVIPHYSFIGSAYVTVISQILLLICTILGSRHIIRVSIFTEKTLFLLWFAFLATYISQYIQNINDYGIYGNIIIGIGIFSLLYGSLPGVFFLIEKKRK